MKKKYIIITFIFLIIFLPFIIAFAQPGTINDPLATQSYVDSRINEIIQTILNMPTASGNIIENSSAFVPVFLPSGSHILAGEGTEIILRAGSARALIPGYDAIVNITNGQELFNNANIPLNNLLIVPREDGRGVTAITDSWLIIRGGFLIQ